MKRRFRKGTKVRLADGKYRARIYVAGRQKEARFDTAALADTWLDDQALRDVEIRKGIRAPEGSRPLATFEDAAVLLRARWKSGQRTYSETTVRRYESHLRPILAAFGSRPIETTRTADVDSWAEARIAEGYSRSTIAQRLTLLSQLAKIARRRDLVSTIPFVVTRPEGGKTSTVSPVTRAEYADLLAAASGDALAIVLLAGDAGLRRSEIPRLLVGDVAIEDRSGTFGSIHIATRSRTARTKSGKGRTVPILTRRLRDVLADLVRDAHPSRRVVVSARNVDAVTRAASAPWRTVFPASSCAALHRLRHRFGTSIAESGRVGVVALQSWMGHRDVSTTQRYFATAETPFVADLESDLTRGKRGARDFRFRPEETVTS